VNLAAGNPRLTPALFKEFQAREERHYEPAEVRMRLAIFRKSVEEAAELNKEEGDVEYGVTLFSDMTDAERQTYLGVNASTTPEEAYPMQPESEAKGLQRYGSSVTHKNRYGKVKRQRASDCWAFSTISVLECHTAIANGRYTELSEQEVVDCTSGSSARNGGWANKALEQIKNRGSHMATGASYRYAARDQSCSYRNHQNALPFTISGPYQVRGNSGLANAVRYATVSAAAMKFSNDFMSSYRGGVYTSSRCNKMQYGNHAVAITGYTNDAFEIRNSWGTYWGKGGYGYVTRRSENHCNVSGYSFYINRNSRGQEQEKEE